MPLSKKRRKQEEQIGYVRQMEGKYPIGLFPDRGVPDARRAGANRAKAQQARMKSGHKK